MSHFIINNAQRYDEPDHDPVPEHATFDDEAGYWADDMSGKVLITNDGFQGMGTKKEDRETGEDQKGE